MMTQAEGARAADALCDRDGGPPQALVCANDQMAVGALHALERRGLTVPDDVAVTGFDGIPSAGSSAPRSPPSASPCCGWGRRRSNSSYAVSAAHPAPIPSL